MSEDPEGFDVDRHDARTAQTLPLLDKASRPQVMSSTKDISTGVRLNNSQLYSTVVVRDSVAEGPDSHELIG